MNAAFDASAIDWGKGEGLLAVIVQHWRDGRVLMLGYMNQDALEITRRSGYVTFYSRSRQQLWTKGETSGNRLELKALHADCDGDALLVLAEPQGPVCHAGTETCFASSREPAIAFLGQLDALVAQRAIQQPENSYTTRLFREGTARIAQKIGEEAVETALASVTGDGNDLLDEAADLFYHLLVLLRARGLGITELSEKLHQRHPQ